MVVETNSCPSGQKAMPLHNEDVEQAGYRVLLERSVMPALRSGTFNGHPLPEGKLAVLYDKNKMEASGYAATLADLAGESVYLVPCYADDFDPKVSSHDFEMLPLQVINVHLTKGRMVHPNYNCTSCNAHLEGSRVP